MLTQTLFCLVALIAISAGEDGVGDPTIQVSLNFLQAAMKENDKNCIISPLSVSTLLSILQQGALGDTLNQLNGVLHSDAAQSRKLYGTLTRELKKSTSASVIIEYATKAFVNGGFEILEPFKQALVREFHSDIQQVNFGDRNAAAQVINSWVQKQTHGKVDELVTPDNLGSDTHLVLANAVYFKGIWASPFDQQKTQDKPFTIQKGVDIQVPTMQRAMFARAAEVPTEGYKWIELPFEGEQFSMYIMLPNEGVSLSSLVAKLAKNDHSFTNILKSKRRRSVELSLPKFKLTSHMDLSKTLKLMGVNDIFVQDKANLKGISNKPLFVSQVLHRVTISIDEKGGTAASSTGVVLQLRSAVDIPIDVMDFTVNRPFLVFIVDKVNMVPFFAGQVINPLKS